VVGDVMSQGGGRSTMKREEVGGEAEGHCCGFVGVGWE